jgi:hypothetical protein
MRSTSAAGGSRRADTAPSASSCRLRRRLHAGGRDCACESVLHLTELHPLVCALLGVVAAGAVPRPRCCRAGRRRRELRQFVEAPVVGERRRDQKELRAVSVPFAKACATRGGTKTVAPAAAVERVLPRTELEHVPVSSRPWRTISHARPAHGAVMRVAARPVASWRFHVRRPRPRSVPGLLRW